MEQMTPKQRFMAAIRREKADRLPVTTHHVLPYYLKKYMNGASSDEFFRYFKLDPIVWAMPQKIKNSIEEYSDDEQANVGFLETRRMSAENWRVKCEEISGQQYPAYRYSFITPKKTLTMTLQYNEYTVWVTEHLIKEKSDIEIIAKYATHPECDVDLVNSIADYYGENALLRGHIICFDVFGQPGCWQDAACLLGIEKLIMETYDDPYWVHEFLEVLYERKRDYIASLKGARYDLLELGGGDASSSVISPRIFNEFVAPYDSRLINLAHENGQRIVYHTCGGMMAILEDIAAMKTDAMETFTPASMGGDTILGEAKRRIGDKVCMIGGFDQFHYFNNCSPEETRKQVRKCFEEAGENGGYILSPSDHFFDAEHELLEAYSDEARKCVY